MVDLEQIDLGQLRVLNTVLLAGIAAAVPAGPDIQFVLTIDDEGVALTFSLPFPDPLPPGSGHLPGASARKTRGARSSSATQGV